VLLSVVTGTLSFLSRVRVRLPQADALLTPPCGPDRRPDHATARRSIRQDRDRLRTAAPSLSKKHPA